MKSIRVSAAEAAEIEKRVDRLLKDVGRPAPPISLSILQKRLSIDVSYYSLESPTMLEGFAHKMRVAGKVLSEPLELVKAVRQMDLKALLVGEKKKILIDDDQHDLKKRWAEAHETTHSLLEWHNDFMYGDHQFTLSPVAEEMIEAEANYGAGLILYPKYFYDDFVAGKPLSIELARSLSEKTKNSITSAGWRLAEHATTPAFFMVSAIPREVAKGVYVDAVKHLVVSAPFERRFSRTQPSELFALLKSKAAPRKAGPLGNFTLQIADDDGFKHEFVFSAFGNGFACLTLGVCEK